MVATASRNGVCPGTNYMSLSWNGQSRSKCLERAAEVANTGPCSAVSYSDSAQPQQQSNFCRCFPECDGELSHPEGEVWETLDPLNPDEASHKQGSPQAGSTLDRQGRCKSSSYQNIGWGGMSKDACVNRAAEVEKDSNQCKFVSYSDSAGPQRQTNFCRCYIDCSVVEIPAGEHWVTMNPAGMSQGDHVATWLISCLAIVGGILALAVCGCGFAISRRRRARDGFARSVDNVSSDSGC